MDNFRPVAVFSVFAKSFKESLNEVTMSYFQPHIADQQHEFLSGRSTVTNLPVLKEYVYEVFDEDYQVDVISADFTKAFDTVPFGRLSTHLKEIGVPGRLV